MTYRTEQDQQRRRDIADAASGYSRSRTRVVIYANVPNGDRDQVTSDLTAHATARDWTIVATCIDVGPTTLPPHQRPGWCEAAKLLTTDAANGGADGLMARSAAQIAGTDHEREELRNWLREVHAFAVYLDDEPHPPAPLLLTADGSAASTVEAPRRKRVVLYANVADADQAPPVMGELREYATARLWTVVRSIHDVGRVGRHRRQRPGWFAVSEILRKDGADGVVAPSVAHIAETPGEQGEFAAWAVSVGVSTEYLAEVGKAGTSTADARQEGVQ
ncbi:hypothetical protein [Streptomyces sp. x-80]|uniref:hypothetical protein n=1 Tax=Streptomyces sp. x-80 TaxID=2789282 RepID=UPI00398192C0